MLLIAGLGNPGKEYQKSRHNLGFMVVDAISQGLGLDFKYDKKKDAELAEYTMTFPNKKKKTKIVLLKPQTYMNNSGEAIQKVAKYYQIKSNNIWVIHDDLDIEFGNIRIRFGGSSAGQKGIESIINSLGTKDFYRFRFGVKNPYLEKTPTEKFVLANFTKEEKTAIDKKIKSFVTDFEKLVNNGPELKTY